MDDLPANHGDRASLQESRLRRLVAATQDAVVFIDSQARVVRFNPSAERIFGFTAAEIQGQKVNVLMADRYAKEHDGYIRRYEQTGEAQAIGQIRVVEACRKNGEVFPIELSVTELPSDDEVRYCAFIRDISEKVRLQEQNNEQRRMAAIGTTAAVLAHEVGNPLNNMQLNTQLAQRRLKQSGLANADLGHNLQIISDEIRRLNELLEEFRLLSRRQSLHLSETNVADLVFQTCEEHRVDFGESQIAMCHRVDRDLPPLRADAGKLRQVLLNLCKNAAEAMPHGGNLDVTLRYASEMFVVEVADTGCGIPADAQVFEPFHTTKEHGTGLGLPIAKRIVLAHGGRISFRPRASGGTVFRVELPEQPPAEADTAPGLS